MVFVEHLLGEREIALDLRAIAPRQRQHPVEIVAHDGRLGRHRRHRPQLLHLRLALLAGVLGKLRLLDAILDLRQLVTDLVAFAELALDRLQLLIQVVLPLRLLHLLLDAIADVLLDLQQADLALHQGEDLLEPLGDALDLQKLLLVRDLHLKVRSDRIGKLRGILDGRDRRDDLGLKLLRELRIVLELARDRAHQRRDFALVGELVVDRLDLGLEEFGLAGEAVDAGARLALHEYLYRLVGELQQLKDGCHRPDDVHVGLRRVVLLRVLLRDEQDLLVIDHHVLERADGFLAADEQRHDHTRKHDDVAQRKQGILSHILLFHSRRAESRPAASCS